MRILRRRTDPPVKIPPPHLPTRNQRSQDCLLALASPRQLRAPREGKSALDQREARCCLPATNRSVLQGNANRSHGKDRRSASSHEQASGDALGLRSRHSRAVQLAKREGSSQKRSARQFGGA